ncbi:hypothetical protein [Brucella anthropi]|uniref:hypothetical protein n=1 Tax=Brucella anthropi TaxID=529 RepID=UPI00125D5252|nr:hypothetical protein [Brucella anthropi]QFP65557.1 hypothetical protein FT787_21145 [Brucella anthropi]
MQNWFIENWVQALTLLASVIGAITGFIAILIGCQQIKLARKAVQRPMPNIHCQARAIDGHANWTKIEITIKNRSDVPVSIESARLRNPRKIRLTTRTISHAFLEERGTLPEEVSDETAPYDLIGTPTLEPAGTPRSLACIGDSYKATTFAFCPPQRIYSARSPSIRLNLRWKDTNATVFHIDVAITTPDKRNVA